MMDDLDTHVMKYVGFVKAKERPRSGKGGRMFTPKETRQFEKSVSDWAKEQWTLPPLRHPVRVDVVVYEAGTEEQIRDCDVIYNQKGDVDNLGKSILDGMNGIVYKDDKQITDLRIRREYSQQPGFCVSIERSGLTKAEYANYLKRRAKGE